MKSFVAFGSLRTPNRYFFSGFELPSSLTQTSKGLELAACAVIQEASITVHKFLPRYNITF